MSVPTTLCARSGKTTSSVSPKKTRLPTEVSPTTKPPNPDQDRRSAITVGELPVLVAAPSRERDFWQRDRPLRTAGLRRAPAPSGPSRCLRTLRQPGSEPHADE